MSDARLIIATPSAVVRGVAGGAAWAYLGTDLRRRARIAERLGPDRFNLAGRFHSATERLRQHFLDFVAMLGRQQADVEGWWASAISWKVCGASDLFQLLAYAFLVEELRREPPSDTVV